MSKEKIITVFEIPPAVEGDPYIRVPSTQDKDPATIRIDRETGEYITLWEEKMRYPYKTRVASFLHIHTTKRYVELQLIMDDDGTFFWNGQNIVPLLWSILRISKHSPEGLQASKWHDILLYRKEEYIEILREMDPKLKICEYRRLTSLIFRQLLVNNGVPKWKAYTMAWFVDQFQKYRFATAFIRKYLFERKKKKHVVVK